MRTIPLVVVCAVLGLAPAGCAREDRAPGDRAAGANEAPATAPTPTPAQGDIAADATPTGRGTMGAATPAGVVQGLGIATTGEYAPYLVNSAGSAVYMLQDDRPGQCDRACAQAWPPLLLEAGGAPVIVAGLDRSLVGTAGRPDGANQITYNGHPLHRYAADTGAGTTAGHGVRDQWGMWYLLDPQGEPVAMPSK